jgi:hypothetical protein
MESAASAPMILDMLEGVTWAVAENDTKTVKTVNNLSME